MASELWMIVRAGRVQRLGGVVINGQTITAWPVADSQEDARKLAKWLGRGTAAMIGSAQGETLEGHLKAAMEDGCSAVICVSGWNSGGEPEWKWRDLQTKGR